MTNFTVTFTFDILQDLSILFISPTPHAEWLLTVFLIFSILHVSETRWATIFDTQLTAWRRKGRETASCATAPKLLKNVSNQRFITAFTRVLQRSLSESDQSNPYHRIVSKIHFIVIHLHTSWSSQWSLSLWLSHQGPICISLCGTCRSRPIPRDLTILLILGKDYKLWSCSLCSFSNLPPHPSSVQVFSAPWSQNTLTVYVP
jgi:hypothetical protein